MASIQNYYDKSLFPKVSAQTTRSNGLLAVGGDLSVKRLIDAYQHGIFPWFRQGEPILWWSPDPRAVIYYNNLKIARSLKKILRHSQYEVTINQAFTQVISACAAPRPKQDGTWLTPAMQNAYCQLHQAGYAHSVEVWQQQQLIAGLYGVDCGYIFTGESMFAVQANGAKIALIYLANYLQQHDYWLIDCQIYNSFLQQLGATIITRNYFLHLLQRNYYENRSSIWPKNSLKLPKIAI